MTEMPIEEAIAKARQYAAEHKDKPSVSRTLVQEIDRLRARVDDLEERIADMES